jgi:hypothetical protein
MGDVGLELREDTDGEEESVERSQLFFDPWLICDHRGVEVLVDQAVHRGEEALRAKLKRKRRREYREAFRLLSSALVANASYAFALGIEPATVATPLAKPNAARSRYDGPGFGQLDAVLAALSPGLVTLRKSRRKGIASALEAGPELVNCIAGLDDFGLHCFRREGGETVFVRRVERDYVLDERTITNIEYQDDPPTDRLHAELRRINDALKRARLGFEEPGGPGVEIRKRQLRRIFNTLDDQPRFDLGGRLHGGWRQTLERVRRHAIRIEGEPIADLDFSAMFLRLAYAKAGLLPPEGDLYAGILQDEEEDRYRPGLKVLVNAMLFRSSPLQRLPKGSAAILPRGCSAAELREDILRRHAPIRDQFEKGIGLSLMKLESDILVSILLRLIDRGIVALQMYDGLMVRHDVAEEVATVMREEAKAWTGFELPVKVARL